MIKRHPLMLIASICYIACWFAFAHGAVYGRKDGVISSAFGLGLATLPLSEIFLPMLHTSSTDVTFAAWAIYILCGLFNLAVICGLAYVIEWIFAKVVAAGIRKGRTK
jgi:hypothetical protein